MASSTSLTRGDHFAPCLKVPISKYSFSIQSNGNDNSGSWTHNTSKNLVAVLDVSKVSTVPIGSTIGVVLQIVNATKVLDTIPVEQLCYATRNTISGAKAHGIDLLRTQYPLTVLYKSPCLQFRYKIDSDRGRRVQLKVAIASDCEELLEFLRRLGCSLQAQGYEQRSSQRSFSSFQEMTRPTISSSITLGRDNGHGSSSPVLIGSRPSSDSFYNASSSSPNRDSATTDGQTFYEQGLESMQPRSRTLPVQAADVDRSRPQSALPFSTYQVKNPSATMPVLGRNRISRPVSHGGFSTSSAMASSYLPPVPTWNPQQLSDSRPLVTLQQLDCGRPADSFMDQASSPKTKPLSQLPESLSHYVPPKRTLPFETQPSAERLEPIHGNESLQSRPASSSLGLPPLPKPSFAPESRPSIQTPGAMRDVPQSSDSRQPIQANTILCNARLLTSEGFNTLKRMSYDYTDNGDPRKRMCHDGSLEASSVQHPISSNFPGGLLISADGESAVLKAYADQSDTLRQATLDGLICQYINDDGFLKLCQDMENNWRKIGLEPPKT